MLSSAQSAVERNPGFRLSPITQTLRELVKLKIFLFFFFSPMLIHGEVRIGNIEVNCYINWDSISNFTVMNNFETLGNLIPYFFSY